MKLYEKFEEREYSDSLTPHECQNYCIAAFTNAKNGGDGFPGRDLNSGWNWELKKMHNSS